MTRYLISLFPQPSASWARAKATGHSRPPSAAKWINFILHFPRIFTAHSRVSPGMEGRGIHSMVHNTENLSYLNLSIKPPGSSHDWSWHLMSRYGGIIAHVDSINTQLPAMALKMATNLGIYSTRFSLPLCRRFDGSRELCTCLLTICVGYTYPRIGLPRSACLDLATET